MSAWGDDPISGTYGLIEKDGTEKLFSYSNSDKWFSFDKIHNCFVLEKSWGWDTGVIVPSGTIALLTGNNLKEKPILVCT